jgi:hypothetical protein
MKLKGNRHSIRAFVNSLETGTRVVWIANGATGTIQADKTILWDNGHHMTHKQMSDSHSLLIHSETERALLREALDNRRKCLKLGCTLARWDASMCIKDVPEKLCPLAVISEPEVPSATGRRIHRKRLGGNLLLTPAQ